MQTVEKLSENELQGNYARLIPIPEWNKYYSYPTQGGLRSLVFQAHKNGFDKVIRRIGGRVLIKEDAFFQWVEDTNRKN